MILLGSCNIEDKAREVSIVEELTKGNYTIFDLTHELSNTSPFWPNETGNPFQYDTIFSQESGAPGMGAYSTPEHFGTHIDAPIHSADQQKSVHELQPKDLFGYGMVLDVTEKCIMNADYKLSKQDILTWEEENGLIPDNTIVIMYTGWCKKWEDYNAYKNQDEKGEMHFPGFSEEAARFLIEERSINGIGIDTFSVDAAISNGFPVHSIVNGAGKFSLENMANIHLLPRSGIYLTVSPVKILGGSGGQVRIFAIVD